MCNVISGWFTSFNICKCEYNEPNFKWQVLIEENRQKIILFYTLDKIEEQGGKICSKIFMILITA